MSWANTWRRWFRQWFPEPPEELVRLRAKARKLAGENRQLRSERDRARSEAARNAAQAEEMERQLGVAKHETQEKESAIDILQMERKSLIDVIKTLDVYQQSTAQIKLTEVAVAEEEASHRRRLRGEE